MAKKKTAPKSAKSKKAAPKKRAKKIAKKQAPATKKKDKKPAAKAVKKVQKSIKKAAPKKTAPPPKKALATKAAKPAVKQAAPVKAAPAAKPTKPVAVAVTKAAPAKQVAVAALANKPAATVVMAAPKPPPPKPVEKRPLKERVTMEFEVRSAPNVLYDLISTPSGFSEWYCDDVDVRGDQYLFKWGRDEEAVTMIGRKAPEVIRFHRNDDTDEAAFFEFRIRIDAMTNEVALIVTDHAWPHEVEETRSLWASQIASLLRVLGA